MQLETEVTYSRDIITTAAWLYWRKNFASTFFISLLLVVVALLMIFFFDSGSWYAAAFLALAMIATAIFGLAFFIYRGRSLAVYNQMQTPRATWILDTETFRVESDIGKSEMKWNVIKRIIRTKRVWLLIYQNNTYSVFPLAGVAPEVQEFMTNKVLEQGGQVT